MATQLRWVGESDLDRVAETRAFCYASAASAIESFRRGIREDVRAAPGDYLLAERDGEAVGTTTSFSFNLWARGTSFPCQGVGYVGTIKTQRRRGGSEHGIATQLMRETLRKAREREQVVSALMPFRASFYEHFGYGIVERRHEWTVPLSLLPTGNFDGMRLLGQADLPAFKQVRQRSVEAGQCDIERSEKSWQLRAAPSVQWQFAGNGLEVIDRPDRTGPAQGYAYFTEEKEGGKSILRVPEWHAVDLPALQRLLHFFASLRDQHSQLRIALPSNVQLNWMLRETQIPHRPVEHSAAEVRPFTRMQMRILDHRAFLEGLHLPPDTKGSAAIAVQEVEGHTSQFRIDISQGRARIKPTTDEPEFQCPDKVWAAVACGALTALDAIATGVATGNANAARVLRPLCEGPPPFCNEYF